MIQQGAFETVVPFSRPKRLLQFVLATNTAPFPLTFPLSSVTKGHGGAGSCGQGGVVDWTGELVLDAVEIKGVCSASPGSFAWWQVMVPVLRIRSDPQMCPNGK